MESHDQASPRASYRTVERRSHVQRMEMTAREDGLRMSLIFGAIVGLSLGLTGGGGAIFAVPMLVYGLGMATREAVGISLAAVGVTSFIGFLGRWRTRPVEIRTGLLFAVAGMVGAPIGSWLAGLIPEPLLLTLFAILMLVVSNRMWSKAVASTQSATTACPVENPDEDGPSCQRDAEGNLRLTSRCASLLLLVGLLTGVLSGLFGVGGGFVIVPALILFSGMAIHRAVGTSLLVITLVSICWSGLAPLRREDDTPGSDRVVHRGWCRGWRRGHAPRHADRSPSLRSRTPKGLRPRHPGSRRILPLSHTLSEVTAWHVRYQYHPEFPPESPPL